VRWNRIAEECCGNDWRVLRAWIGLENALGLPKIDYEKLMPHRACGCLLSLMLNEQVCLDVTNHLMLISFR